MDFSPRIRPVTLLCVEKGNSITTMNEAAQAHEGQIIEDRYRIISKIADGGMATVYEALDERLSRHVAIKIMHTKLSQGAHGAQFEERFRREARSAAAIANPHIVQVYDTGQVDGLDFLVMQYVHGVNLRYEMNQQDTFSVRETLRILTEILDGLASAHEAGVIHRDIKPENILLNDRGHVEITDFGLARAVSQSTLSSTGMLLGTAAYLPPETIESNQALPQSDLYSVGIVAYEMLTGSVPFASENPVTVVFKHVHENVPSLQRTFPDLDPAVSDFIGKLVARSVEDRPADAGIALSQIKSLTANLSAKALQIRMDSTNRSMTPSSHEGKPILEGSLPATHDDLFKDIDTIADSPSHEDLSPDVEPSVSDNDSNHDNNASITKTSLLPQTQSGRSTSEKTTEHMPTETVLSELDSREQPKSHRKMIFAGLIISFLVIVLAGGTAGWWHFKGPGSYWKLPKPDDITCPQTETCSIKGADFSKYQQNLTVAGIPHESTQAYSDTIPEGHIISAVPETVDSHISKRNGKITLVVSRGIQSFAVPADILDPNSESGSHPIEALKNAGFDNIQHNEQQDQYSMDVPKGAVLTISPQPGTVIKHNEQVTVTLSKGKMPISMPDLTGKLRKEAVDILSANRLTVNVSEQWSDTVGSGLVISTAQKPGQELHWGDQVDIVVSKGPQTVTIPRLIGKNEDEAAKELKDMGLEVKISAPLGDLTHMVRRQDPEPGQQVRIRGEDGKPTVVTLTVV